MVTYRLRILGREIASLEIADEPPAPPPRGITGGSGHNYERTDSELNEFGFVTKPWED